MARRPIPASSWSHGVERRNGVNIFGSRDASASSARPRLHISGSTHVPRRARPEALGKALSSHLFPLVSVRSSCASREVPGSTPARTRGLIQR